MKLVLLISMKQMNLYIFNNIFTGHW